MNGLECSYQLRSADALEDVALGTGDQCSGDARHIIECREHHELATGAILAIPSTVSTPNSDVLMSMSRRSGAASRSARCASAAVALSATSQSASERAMAWTTPVRKNRVGIDDGNADSPGRARCQGSTPNACCHNFLHQGKGCRPRRIRPCLRWGHAPMRNPALGDRAVGSRIAIASQEHLPQPSVAGPILSPCKTVCAEVSARRRSKAHGGRSGSARSPECRWSDSQGRQRDGRERA